MSYFLVATGAVPLIDDIPALSFVPTAQAQAYVADIVSETVESCDRAVTYLLDDGTQTSDEVITESSEQIVGALRSRRRVWDRSCFDSSRLAAPSASGGLLRRAICRDSMSVTTATSSSSGLSIAWVQALT